MIDINNLGDMDIENMTSEEKTELLDAIVERAEKIVWKQEYLILKEGDKEIYRVKTHGRNKAFHDSFYKNLNLNVDWDKWELKETEVDFNELFYEWWRCICGSFVDTADTFYKDINRRYKEDVVNALTYYDTTKVGRFFTVFREVRKYTHKAKPKSDIYLAEGHFLKLDDRYKLYVELCDWKPSKN